MFTQPIFRVCHRIGIYACLAESRLLLGLSKTTTCLALECNKGNYQMLTFFVKATVYAAKRLNGCWSLNFCVCKIFALALRHMHEFRCSQSLVACQNINHYCLSYVLFFMAFYCQNRSIPIIPLLNDITLIPNQKSQWLS